VEKTLAYKSLPGSRVGAGTAISTSDILALRVSALYDRHIRSLTSDACILSNTFTENN